MEIEFILNLLKERRNYYNENKYEASGHELVLPHEFDAIMNYMKRLEQKVNYLEYGLTEYELETIPNLKFKLEKLEKENKELKKNYALADKLIENIGELSLEYDNYIKKVLENET